MSEKIYDLLKRCGPQTATGLAHALGVRPADIIGELRHLTARGVIDDLNGFYTAGIVRGGAPGFRRSYEWVEGAVIPRWVIRLAAGDAGTGRVLVLAELSATLCDKGYPPFALAEINPAERTFKLCGTGESVGDRIERYLPVDVRYMMQV